MRFNNAAGIILLSIYLDILPKVAAKKTTTYTKSDKITY